MPHYIDGTEAKVGDDVASAPESKHYMPVKHGKILKIYPGATSCNATIATLGTHEIDGFPVPVVNITTQTIGEFKKI